MTRDPVATVSELKSDDGKDIWLWGSLQLMRSLLDAGLIDEVVRMLLCPASRGEGTRLFPGSHDLELLEATAFENGVALLRYAVNTSEE